VEAREGTLTFEDLIECPSAACSAGERAAAAPPLLMFDRIVKIADPAGNMQGRSVALSSNVKPDLWFFASISKGDPLCPGCLGLDAMCSCWVLPRLEEAGHGRANRRGSRSATGMIVPTVKKLHVPRASQAGVILRMLVLGIATASYHADGTPVYEALT